MYEARIDIAVLILFFCRDEQLAKVFEAVKLARPTRLYLYQDGPRENRKDDEEGIARCREIVSDDNIDWECTVYRNYQSKNFGCDPSEYMAQTWMFSQEDMGIVLEDDDVPAQSFFPFCKELLEKYRDDCTVNIICGMNNVGVSKDIKESYFFTKKGSIWGWASWKRVIDTWDATYSWLDDTDALIKIRSQMTKKDYDKYIKTAREHKASGKAHYESILGASTYIYDRLNIVPKFNMISNIGIAQETTHSVSDVRLLPKAIRKLFYAQTYEIDFPLIHPKDKVRNLRFEREMSFSHLKEFLNRIEHSFLVIRYNGVDGFLKLVKKKLFR